MASGTERLGDQVHVVRGRGVRRDVWAGVVLAVAVVAGLSVLRSGPGTAPPSPALAHEAVPPGAPGGTEPTAANQASDTTPTLPGAMPRTRAGKLRALRALGVTPTQGPDGKRRLDAAPVIEALNRAGIHDGIAAFPPPGTDPPKAGVIVPDGIELPEGYLRHYQTTDDGEPLPPILMFHPDYTFTDESGQPIAIPADRVVPPELVPEGFPVQLLEIPARRDGR